MRQEKRATAPTKNMHSAPKRPRKKQPSSVYVFVISLCVALSLLSAYLIAGQNGTPLAGDDMSPAAYNENNPSVSEQAPSQPHVPAQSHHAYCDIYEYTSIYSQILTFEQLAEISNDRLLLVNMNHAIPPYISGNLARISDYITALNADTLLDEHVLAMLRIMFDSAAGAGFTQFRVTQGFRTHEYQQMLFDTAIDRSLVALPGHSEHQVGLAVDISYEGVNIGNSIQGAWLMENSYRYGFILRYPAHKTHITMVPFEPWHYRYVGQPHAYFMTRNDLVLEEYIELLKTTGNLTITFNGVVYRVYYLSGPGTTIEMPEDYSFWASSDNTGGIIVTMRRCT